MKKIRPCSCGHTPKLNHRTVNGIQIIQIECECGKRGAHLMFTKREHEEKMEQAAIDGWNLAL